LEARLFGHSKMKVLNAIWAHLQFLTRILLQKRPASQLEKMESPNEFY
jgi:hypothetical protein